MQAAFQELGCQPEDRYRTDKVLKGLTLECRIHTGPLTVSLLCAAPGFASVPKTVTIPTGAASASFIVTTPSIGIPFKTAQADILATLGGSSVGATLTVLPSVVAGTLKGLTVFPDQVTGGNSSTGTVTLEDAVPTDTLVGLAAVEPGTGPLPLPGQGSSVVRFPHRSRSRQGGPPVPFGFRPPCFRP